jgi:hypothetical protein
VALLALLSFTVLAVDAGDALAVEYGHTVVTGEYGREGPKSPGAYGCVIAFQSAENKLYVMQGESIYGMQWNGPGSVTALGGNFPLHNTNAECYGAQPDFTVDQTNGNIYQTPVYEPHLYGWDKTGTPLSGFPVTFEGVYQVCGLATTNDAEPWAGDLASPSHVYKSSPQGGQFGSIELAQEYACKIGIDQTNNDLYALEIYGHVIKQYSAAGGYAPTGLTFAASPETENVHFVVDGSTHTLYVPFRETVRAYDTTTGAVKEEIEFGGGDTLGVAIDEDTGTLFIADRQNEVIKEMPKTIVPKAVTGDPIGNFEVSGVADPNGAGNIVECFFEYGPAAGNYSLGKQNCDQGLPITGETPVTATLSAAPFEQTTHYRLVVKTASLGGVRRGADKTITPHAVEGLLAEGATNVTRTSAQLHGSFEGNGEETKYKFQWGIYNPGSPESYESESALTSIGSPTAPPRTNIPLALNGLTAEKTYHFRIVAQNGKGTSQSNDVTFKTLPPVQSLTAEPADEIGPRTATLHGSFVGDGDDTTYYFKYGTTEGFYPNTTAPATLPSPTGLTHIQAPISGLELETTYHFRIVATNSLGTTETADTTFTSRPAVEGVISNAATGISQTSITLNGQYDGNGHDIRYHFEYGPTTAYGESTPEVDGGTAAGTQNVSAAITDYLAYTTYHYRLVAEDTDVSVNGVTYGPDMTVTTEPALLPGLSGTRVNGVTPTTATMEAEVNPNRWPTVFRFDYGTNTGYGGSTEFLGPIGRDTTAHTVSAGADELIPGTLYHYRVVAINFSGTAYGPDMTFFTPTPPGIESISSSGITETGARLLASVIPNAGDTTVRFEYGTTTGYGLSSGEAPAGADTSTHEVGATLTGLAPGTTYHFRAVATNSYGSTATSDQTFTTAPAATRAEEPKPRPRCRKGFVSRHGKCVRKHRKHRHGGHHHG